MCNPWLGKIPRRRKWLPTPVFLPGEFHGQRNLASYSSWGHKESFTTEWLTHTHTHTHNMPLTLARLLCGQINTSSREPRLTHGQCPRSPAFISALALTPTLVLPPPDLRILNLLWNFGPIHLPLGYILMSTLNSEHNWAQTQVLFYLRSQRKLFSWFNSNPKANAMSGPLFYALTVP